MSFTKTAVAAAAMSLSMLTGALAQGAGGGLEAWDIRDRSAYIVMMDGKMMRMTLGAKGTTLLMKHARKVPHGTVFMMSGGQLYMINAAKMFDRAGMPSFGGG